MANTYPITAEQMAVLDSFTCERLTTSYENLIRIQSFRSENGPGLVNNLLCNGWKSDIEGSTAYYVIKAPDRQIVMFFSLKCGVLFDPDYVLEYMDNFREAFLDDRLLKKWQRYMDGDPEAAQFFRQKMLEMGRTQFDDFVESLLIKGDKKHEPNKKIIRVAEARSAIELVEFCANDATRHCWSKYGMGPHHKLGETLFWKFIVPKMLEINKLIGCEFVYLFAADKTPNGKLSNYYREALHFENLTELGAIKPSYDFNCFFMGNRLRPETGYRSMWGIPADDDDSRRTDLEHYQKLFFDNFNLTADADDFV